MTHFRRMDPQPPNHDPLKARTLNGVLTFENMRGFWSAPPDMPGARPWRDRDGDWYWRRDHR